jgi:hypothetical protein
LIIDNDEAKWREYAEFKVAPIGALADFRGVVIISAQGKEEEIAQQIDACHGLQNYQIISYQRIIDIIRGLEIERGMP